MRTAVVVTILLVVLPVALPWLRGVLRALRHTPSPTRPTHMPRIDIESAPSVITPGGVLVLRVAVRDADRCSLGWRDGRSRPIPDGDRDVGLDGIVQWRLRLPENLKPGPRALVVTAVGPLGRGRGLVPVHVLEADDAAAHAEIEPLTLAPPTDRAARIGWDERARRFGAFTGLYTARVSAEETKAARGAAPPRMGSDVTALDDRKMLEASITPSPDTETELFDGEATDRTEAAS